MAQAYPHLHVVLLCEDFGARLWPIAREQAPACFARVGSSGQTLLSAAVERALPFTSARLSIVTSELMAPSIYSMLTAQGQLGEDDFELLTLPAQRGSAFAIALATAYIRRQDPQAVVAVFRTDQQVTVDDRWEHLMYRAYQIALQDRIVLLGGQQAEKCAEYTYIRRGRQFPGVDDAYVVRLFRADQPPASARRICAEGAYWYTGAFVARAAVVMGELANAGEMGRSADASASHRIAETATFLAQLDPQAWLHQDAREVIATLPRVSYDKAALEVSGKLVVLPTTVAFSMLASLGDLDALEVPSRAGNRCLGRAGLTVDCRNTTVYADGDNRQVVALGLRDALIVETPDVLLVTLKGKLDEMPQAQRALAAKVGGSAQQAAYRPFSWGSATLVASDAGAITGDEGPVPATYATWRLELCAGATLDTLTIPYAYEMFGVDAFCEQYVLLGGTVQTTNRRGSQPCARVPGDAFEVVAPRPLRVTNTGDDLAQLLLTAVVRAE